MEQTSQEVLLWWAGMSSVAVFNIAVWWRFTRPLKSSGRAADDKWWQRQRILSAVFVFGCAFRSFLPRADVQRFCLYDSWLSSVLLGRAVATAAELSFVAQMALYLHRLAAQHHTRAALSLSRLIVPLICVAETFSWYASTTTNYLGNVCEESLWAVTGVLLMAGFSFVWPRFDVRTRRHLTVPLLAAPAYLYFMASVDVPMYLDRWRADQLARKTYLTPWDGLQDLAQRRILTYRLEDWRTEMPWMVAYFSVAVWISIAIATRVTIPGAVASAVGGNSDRERSPETRRSASSLRSG